MTLFVQTRFLRPCVLFPVGRTDVEKMMPPGRADVEKMMLGLRQGVLGGREPGSVCLLSVLMLKV